MHEYNAIYEAHAKRFVAEAGRMLLDEELAARTWGNVSCRTAENAMVITPSGMSYETMQAEDIVPFNLDTGEWTGTRKPSSEKLIHIAAYRAFPEAGFVLHTHQTYASAIGLSGFDTLELSDEERLDLGGVALSPYGLPGSKKLAGNVTAAFESGAHVVLMARHGAVIAGRDREEAFFRAKLLEQVCKRTCKGQGASNAPLNETFARQLDAAANSAYGCAAVGTALPLVKCASTFESITAQLDDAAQMIGARIVTIGNGERAVIAALARREIVLVPGVGAVCHATDAEDCRALLRLAEKACVCFLHTYARGDNSRLSPVDTMLMRMIYLKKYAKKIGG